MTLTDLELEVLRHIVAGRDPWDGMRVWRTGTGSRRVSQAVGRLERKGAISRLGQYVATADGLEAVKAADASSGRR